MYVRAGGGRGGWRRWPVQGVCYCYAIAVPFACWVPYACWGTYCVLGGVFVACLSLQETKSGVSYEPKVGTLEAERQCALHVWTKGSALEGKIRRSRLRKWVH